MELSKADSVVLMSYVTNSIGIDGLIELLGKEEVETLDTVAIDLVGNTTPNEIALIGPSIIKRLANSVLGVETDAAKCPNCGGTLEITELSIDDKVVDASAYCGNCRD